jgi:hypothetical protein
MAGPPRNMQSRSPKGSGGGSPPTRGRGLTPPASMTNAGKMLTPVPRVQPNIERTVQRPIPDKFSGGDR